MKTGYHAVYPSGFFEGIDDAYNNGFDFVQFDLGVPKFFLDNLSNEQLIAIKDYANEKDVKITFHAPGDNVSLICDYPLIRKGILDEFKLILEKANLLNARHVTFHAGVYPQFKKSGCKIDDSYSAHYEEIFYENLKYLTENCGDVFICIENLGLDENKRRAIKELLNDTQPLFLTLDTAKLYMDRSCLKINKDDMEFFTQNKDFIREIHIHDMNKDFGGHQIVGTGNVDFQLFKPFVNENVFLNFEVRPVEAAKQSKDILIQHWEV